MTNNVNTTHMTEKMCYWQIEIQYKYTLTIFSCHYVILLFTYDTSIT